MNNFTFYNPCRILFGAGQIDGLGKLVKQYSDNILLVYGKGSIKKSGLYDEVVARLRDEDISFTVTKNAETNEMLLSGVGETQLEILCRKLKNKFGVEAVLKEPRIAYRETIKKMAEAEGKHKKQSGGAGQFGQCSVRFEPGAADGQFEFVDAVVGGAVPRQFIPAVE